MPEEPQKVMDNIKPENDNNLESNMYFNNINDGNNCNCCKDAKEDKNNYFAIKTNKNTLRPQDFFSYWEKGKRPEIDGCKEVCSLKGVSISIFSDETEQEVTNIYKSLFQLAPGYKPHLTVIKFYESSGLVKHTPSRMNKHHYDFYKCDSFNYSKVDLIKVKELH